LFLSNNTTLFSKHDTIFSFFISGIYKILLKFQTVSFLIFKHYTKEKIIKIPVIDKDYKKYKNVIGLSTVRFGD
jgi:hypothetical protein